MRFRKLAAAAVLTAMSTTAMAQSIRPDQAAFRDLYKELVETNTTLSAGSCTLAAERMAARLKAAGYSDKDVTLFAAPDHPKEGGLVAVLQGTSKTVKPMLLLAHIDVVEARREDWVRDPFTLIEEGGYFYARGAADDKAQAAIWTDAMIRFKKEGFRPQRTIKLALTCGEESVTAFNGAEYLARNKADLISAEFALNEGGGGRLDKNGKKVALSMQVGEKTVQNYLFETTNPGGHSSVPRPDNAIYSLTAAVSKVGAYEFPIMFTDTTRVFFKRAGDAVGGEMGTAMKALVANPNDAAANAIVSKDASYHSMLRTTCVATMMEAGHAMNALPQRARAVVNCRIFPGVSTDLIRDELAKVVGDPSVSITKIPPVRPVAVPPPLSPKIFGPAEKLAAKHFPGVPMIPTMSTGGTDAPYLSLAGIPTYGMPGVFGDADGNGAHGLNERIRVSALYEGRDYLFELAKIYANQK
ncbi:MAG: M20/M25/M40 family metallo-hydrolase [Alphaproteobacteria bacterium]|nr:M20/M25/M40 family metallo-hydrolase [Alphaproteobacteria bacterium]